MFPIIGNCALIDVPPAVEHSFEELASSFAQKLSRKTNIWRGQIPSRLQVTRKRQFAILSTRQETLLGESSKTMFICFAYADFLGGNVTVIMYSINISNVSAYSFI